MPHAWALVDSSFPTFADDEKTGKKIEKLVDYMKILVEALQYQLENLDTENWNISALETFQTDTTAEVEEQVATQASYLLMLTNEIGKLSSRLQSVEGISGQVTQMSENLTKLTAEVEELRSVLQKDTDGNTTLGTEGKDLHLLGSVYINGKLME